MTVIYVLLCIVCAALTGLVLIQDSKSGGLGGITGSSTMASLGANTDKTIIKITAICAFLFFALILMTHLIDRSDSRYNSVMTGKGKAAQVDAKKDDTTAKKEAPKPKSNIIDTAKEGTSVTLPIPTGDDTSKAVDTDVKKDIKPEEKAAEKKSGEATDQKVDEPKKADTPK